MVEGVLEWTEVLPQYQGLGYGKKIVNSLLYRLQSHAKFVTVSGRLNNKSNPEKLYRQCGLVEMIFG
jgi:GNAT superfamily N-acetyltransferase